jgi:hypothetical protein
MSNPTALVQKLWNYCNILRDDGLSYGDYVEQLTFPLFLRMTDELRNHHSTKCPPCRWAKTGRVCWRRMATNWNRVERDGLPKAALMGAQRR